MKSKYRKDQINKVLDEIANDKETIFERGFGKNTGLGLFLSREILSITNITIKESGEFQHGARFEMFVPKGVYRLSKNDNSR